MRCARHPAGPENIRMVGLPDLRRFQIREPGRCRLVARDGTRLPGQQAGRDQSLHHQPPRRARQFGAPALLSAIRPQVIVVNNGPRKGLGAKDERTRVIATPGTAPYERVRYLRMKGHPAWKTSGRATVDDRQDPAHNTPPDMIANLEEGMSSIQATDQRHGRPRRTVHAHQRAQQLQQDLHHKEVVASACACVLLSPMPARLFSPQR